MHCGVHEAFVEQRSFRIFMLETLLQVYANSTLQAGLQGVKIQHAFSAPYHYKEMKPFLM